MNILYEEHQRVLTKLIEHQVQFILIGGYAINYYGYHRTTGDMDIWLMPDNNNKLLLIAALKQLDFDDEGLAIVASWDFTQAQKFYVGDKSQPDRTDFMTYISGVDYEEARREAILFETGGLKLSIIHIQQLLKNKKATGRLKDLADAEYLEKIIEIRRTDNRL